MSTAEAPFMREMRLALASWLDRATTYEDIQSSGELSQFLDWTKHKSMSSNSPKRQQKKTKTKNDKPCLEDFTLLKVKNKYKIKIKIKI